MICNDADVACLAESLHGAGKGYSPVFYMTVGTGIGGGVVIDGRIYRGCGHGAWKSAISSSAARTFSNRSPRVGASRPRAKRDPRLDALRASLGRNVKVKDLAAAVRAGNAPAKEHIELAIAALAEGIQQMIKLLCPRRIVIGGGVSLIGDDLFFDPLRTKLAGREAPALRGADRCRSRGSRGRGRNPRRLALHGRRSWVEADRRSLSLTPDRPRRHASENGFGPGSPNMMRQQSLLDRIGKAVEATGHR